MTKLKGAPNAGATASLPRVGVIGTGFIGTEHARTWARLDVPLHLFSRSEAPGLASAVGAASHTSLESFWDAIDVLDICLPTHLHHEYVIEAARRGKHVICEKPLGLTAQQTQEMIEATERAGVQLHVGHVVRYFPEYVKAREAIQAGKVGNLAVLRLARESYPPQRDSTNWIFNEALSGGIIGDLMTHDIDFALWVAGPVERVYAKYVNVTSEAAADHAYAILTHANGTLTHLTASWAQVAPRFRTRIDIAGSSGLLTYDSEASTPVMVSHRRPETAGTDTDDVGFPQRDMHELNDDPFTAQLREFIQAVMDGAETRTHTLDAVETVRVAEAALSSARSGKPVVVTKDAA